MVLISYESVLARPLPPCLDMCDLARLAIKRQPDLRKGGSRGRGRAAAPHKVRAASDDALFERAVSRFDTREDKRRPQPFARPSTGRDTLPGEGTWETLSPGGARLNANASCTISR